MEGGGVARDWTTGKCTKNSVHLSRAATRFSGLRVDPHPYGTGQKGLGLGFPGLRVDPHPYGKGEKGPCGRGALLALPRPWG
jgi:hypothetical protein